MSAYEPDIQFDPLLLTEKFEKKTYKKCDTL